MSGRHLYIGHLPLKGVIAKLYSVTLTYFLKVTHLNLSETVRASATCEMTIGTWRFSNILGKMNTKLFLQIRLNLYDTRRRVALVITTE